MLTRKAQQLSELVSQHTNTNRDLADLVAKLEEGNRNSKFNADAHVKLGNFVYKNHATFPSSIHDSVVHTGRVKRWRR